MMQRVTDQLRELLAEPNALACESSLRAAAATLANTGARDITATRVIGVLGPDDQPEFEKLVSDIARDYNLVCTIGFRGDSFAVRFSRPA